MTHVPFMLLALLIVFQLSLAEANHKERDKSHGHRQLRGFHPLKRAKETRPSRGVKLRDYLAKDEDLPLKRRVGLRSFEVRFPSQRTAKEARPQRSFSIVDDVETKEFPSGGGEPRDLQDDFWTELEHEGLARDPAVEAKEFPSSEEPRDLQDTRSELWLELESLVREFCSNSVDIAKEFASEEPRDLPDDFWTELEHKLEALAREQEAMNPPSGEASRDLQEELEVMAREYCDKSVESRHVSNMEEKLFIQSKGDSEFGNQVMDKLMKEEAGSGAREIHENDVELVEDFLSDSLFTFDRTLQKRSSSTRRKHHAPEDQETTHISQSNIPHPENVDEMFTDSSMVKRQTVAEKPVDPSEGCNKELTASTAIQILYSHDEYQQGTNYSNSLDCVFLFSAPLGYHLWFHFIHFDVEYNFQCMFDYIQIFRDELSRDNSVTERLCGSESPEAMVVNSSIAYIHFHTDTTETRRGFKLEYKALYNGSEPQRSCIYGNDITCAFECHCQQGDCDPLTGFCPRNICLTEDQHDDKLEVAWAGEDCQEGNVALGKPVFTLSGDAGPATDGYNGSNSIKDNCITVRAETADASNVEVDLGGLYHIDYVIVYGAPEGTEEAETLRDFFVKQTPSRETRAGGCGSFSGEVVGSQKVSCPVNTRFVSIVRREDPIYDNYDWVVCEIQVYGYKIYNVDCERCAADTCDENKLCTECEPTFTTPTCDSIIDCGPPPVPEHGHVQYNTTHTPSVAYFSCDESYTLKGYTMSLCGYEMDEWDGTAICVRKCGGVPDIDNAYYPGVGQGVEGDYVEYVCMDNYVQTGGSYLVCSDGQWMSPTEPPKCEETTCKEFEVDDPNIRKIYGNGTDVGSVVIYSCDEGYFIRGQVDNKYTMKCQINGNWDKVVPACEAFCGDFYASSEGTLVSPNYPNKYPARINCTWVIQVPMPGDRINVTIVDMDIEFASNCIYDKLNLYESNGHHVIPIGEYCGSNQPQPVLTLGNYLIVNLYSDEAYQGGGFRLVYNTIRSDDMVTASEALLNFYPVLNGEHVLLVDRQVFAEAIVYMRSYLLTVTSLVDHGECLFLLETIDASYNLLAHHALPEMVRYVTKSFARVEIHAPPDYHTMKVLQEVQENKIIDRIIEQIYSPFVDLGNRALALSGLETIDASSYDAMNGILFHWLEELIFDKSFIVPIIPAEELAITIAMEAHRRITTALELSTSSEVICNPLSQTLSEFLMALDGTITDVERLLSSLPVIITEAFGPDAEDFAMLFITELAEQYEKLSLPLDVLIALRDQLFNVDLSELPNIGSGTTPVPGVITPQELKIKFTGPATHVLLQHGLEMTIHMVREDHIKADIMKQMLQVVPGANMVHVKDLSKMTFESLVRVFAMTIAEKGYVNCLEPKLVSMLIGFAEVQLFDIALTDHNITDLSMELMDIITAEVPGMDWEAVLVNLMNKFRSTLFDSYRQHFLEFEADILEAFGGDIPSKTIPMDLLLMLAAQPPHTVYDFAEAMVEIVVPLLRVNITCPPSDIYISIGRAVETFVTSFDVNAIMGDIYRNLMFVEQIPEDIADDMLEKMRAHMVNLLNLILDPYEYLRIIDDVDEYKMIMTEYVVQGLATFFHNIINLKTPENPEIDLEDLANVIHRQHEGMKAVLEQYIQGMKEILDAVGGDRVDICEVFPKACDFHLELSLMRR